MQHQDKVQLNKVQRETTKRCVNLWRSHYSSSEPQIKGGSGGLINDSYCFLCFFFFFNKETFPGRASGRCKPGTQNKGKWGNEVNVFHPATTHVTRVSSLNISLAGGGGAGKKTGGKKKYFDSWKGILARRCLCKALTKAAGLMNQALKVIIHSGATWNPLSPEVTINADGLFEVERLKFTPQ